MKWDTLTLMWRHYHKVTKYMLCHIVTVLGIRDDKIWREDMVRSHCTNSLRAYDTKLVKSNFWLERIFIIRIWARLSFTLVQLWAHKSLGTCVPESHNAPVPYPTMHHFCNRNVHMCAHFCYKMVHCRIFEMDLLHDDFIKWKHLPHYWPFVWGIHRSPVNSPHKGQWRGALMFSLIYARIKGWVNNREAGDLRRHHAHYNVIVMDIRWPEHTGCHFVNGDLMWRQYATVSKNCEVLYRHKNYTVFLYVWMFSCEYDCTKILKYLKYARQLYRNHKFYVGLGTNGNNSSLNDARFDIRNSILPQLSPDIRWPYDVISEIRQRYASRFEYRRVEISTLWG